jgi:hypothetical protein
MNEKIQRLLERIKEVRLEYNTLSDEEKIEFEKGLDKIAVECTSAIV